MIRFCGALALSVSLAAASFAQPTYVDLSTLFDTDVVLEAGGAGLTDPLDEAEGYLDATTLPAGYSDGEPFGDARSFLFAPLQSESLDALRVDGQRIEVPAGMYTSLDIALLAAPGSYGNPLSNILLEYADGSMDEARLGPIAGWQASPSAFDNIRYTFVDDSAVSTITEFDALSADEELFLLQENGSGTTGDARFIDAGGFALYVLEVPESVDQAMLGITMGNNFVVSIATEYFDPEFSTTEGFTEIANSMEIYDGFEHRALGNLQLYEFDVTPFIEEQTGELYVLFTDATPANGWGPYVQNLQLFSGEIQRFDETLGVQATTVDGEIHAQFQTDGNDTEAEYLYDNRASGPSNRGHRFADAGGSLTYRFDFPDELSDASIMVDMANNFVVSLSAGTGSTRLAQMSPGTGTENDFLAEDNGSILGGNHRFADASASMTYRFDLDDALTEAFAVITVGNQFVIEMAGADQSFELVQDYVAETGTEPRDNSNLADYTFDLSAYLSGNSTNEVYIRFSDGQPADGWGADLYSITIVDQPESGEDVFTEVLRSDEMFGEDVRNEYNKDYYTIELAETLANNPTNEVFIRFTDGTTADGWGPGVFWMAAYSGEIELNRDQNIAPGLKTIAGTPEVISAGLNSRRYMLDSTKTLSAIVLPGIPTEAEDSVYLLGVTANASDTAITEWSLF